MAKISFSLKFLKEVIQIFKERSLKEIIFGKSTRLKKSEDELLDWIKKNQQDFEKIGGGQGAFVKIDIIHKAKGMVYLLPNTIDDENNQSLLILAPETVITPGPDLYIYLSTNRNIKKEGLGEYLDLGLIKGTKGGHSYIIDQEIKNLHKYKSAVIWCKQFAVLFSYAILK